MRLFFLIAFCLLSLPAFTTEIEEDAGTLCWGYCFVTYGLMITQPPDYQEFTCNDMFAFVHKKIKKDKIYSKKELEQLVSDYCKKYDTKDDSYRYEACMDSGDQAIVCLVKTGESLLPRLSE